MNSDPTDLFAVVSFLERVSGFSVVRLTWATLLVGTDGRPVCGTSTTADAEADVWRLGVAWAETVLMSNATMGEA